MRSDRIAFPLAVAAALFFAMETAAQTTVPVTIQLPSFSIFSVDTTVVVPDSGRGYLGRVNRIRQGQTSAGTPFLNKAIPGLRNRALGRETTHSGMHATATILDRTELDPYTRETASLIPSAARDENDAAGLAIDFLRARYASTAASRLQENSRFSRSASRASAAARLKRLPSSTAIPRTGRPVAHASSSLDSRARGLLRFDRRRPLSPIDPIAVPRRTPRREPSVAERLREPDSSARSRPRPSARRMPLGRSSRSPLSTYPLSPAPGEGSRR